MDANLYRLYSRAVNWLVAAAVATYALTELRRAWPELVEATPILLSLMLPAAVAARMATLRPTELAPRGALTFVLAAIALLPPPAGLIVACVASLAGQGRGVAGTYRGGISGFTALATAVAVGDYVGGLFPWPADPASPLTLAPLALAFLVIQGFGLVVGLALDERAELDLLRRPLEAWRSTMLETLTVPLAWMLAALLGQQAWLPALGFSALILLTLEVLLRLGKALGQLREVHESLTSRITELAALHAIGRDILATIDPERVYSLIDRECRKILDIHACSVILAAQDGSRMRRVYSRNGSKVQIGEQSVKGGLAARVLHQKSGQKIADAFSLPEKGSLRGNLLDRQARSAMAVPLIVEGRVVGVLAVESRQPHAYDEHQLSVLTTIGQQAAVAIENARHYQMATVDSLTGFLVKDYFYGRLKDEDERVRRYGGQLALLMVDLDGFKAINDTHGHLVGDKFLAEITGTIRQQLRGADLACRYGGDEFCLLLPETDLVGAQSIAERIRTAVARRIVIVDGVPLRATVSIGVANFPDHDRGNLRGLMAAADEALYRAKRTGRDRVESSAA